VHFPAALAMICVLLLVGGCSLARLNPFSDPDVQRGKASWYGDRFQGRPTASGERFNMHALTASHPSLPFGTVVRVTHVANGRSVDVRINDRFGGHRGRIIDLSKAAFARLAPLDAGVIEVQVQVIQQAGSGRR
jgi:rare lipoprotein A